MSVISLGDIQFSAAGPTLGTETKVVGEGLDSFNRQAAPLDTVNPLACLAKLSTGEVIGGAVGRTWGACCELQQLWVAEECRLCGIGTELLKRFETEAYSRGCRTFYLETFSFQSPELYLRMGYKTCSTISGFPNGIAKYVLMREMR